MKKQNGIIGTGVITAIAASLCCVTPVLALLAGTSGIVSFFSWLEPLRPYFIGITILTLGFAWYQKLSPVKKDSCDCDATGKSRFIHGKTFLGLVTVFAVFMLAFPYYSKVFYPESTKQIFVTSGAVIKVVELKIKGMTCTACEEHVKQEVNKLPGTVKSEVSYANRNAIITFDTVKTTVSDIEMAINGTGYKVVGTKLK